MRDILTICAVGLALAGCHWFGAKDDVIKPDEQSALPAGDVAPPPAQDTPPATSAPATAAAATSQPDPPPATAPYRVVGNPEVIESAVIQVNYRFVTVDQVLARIGTQLRSAAAGGAEAFLTQAAGLIRQEIRRQIEQSLLLAEADKRLGEGVTKAIDEEVRNRYREALTRVGGSKTAFANRLAEEGMDLETWQADMIASMKIQTHIHQRLGKNVYVTRRMMMRHYQKHGHEFSTDSRVQMQLVSVPFATFLPTDRAPTEADRRDALQKAREAIAKAAAQIAGGADFAEVARNHSKGPMAPQGGVWPEMELGSFRAAKVESAAFAQQVGQVSKPIETAGGMYLVKTLARNPGRQRPFADVQDEITKTLRQEQYERLTKEYLAELRGKASIGPIGPFEKVALKAAAERHYLPRGPAGP